MNNHFVSIFNRKIYVVLLVFVLILVLYMAMNETHVFSRTLNLISNTYSYNFSFITIILVITLFLVVLFFNEIWLDNEVQSNHDQQYILNKQDLKDLNKKIAKSVSISAFNKNVDDCCDTFWYQGDIEAYHKYVGLQKELLHYIVRMQNPEIVVSWREERQHLIMMIELLNLCRDTSNFKLDLFDSTSNYRFPAGLFIIPFFNAIEYAFLYEDSSLRIESFNVSGLWNCQISNYMLPTARPKKSFKYIGYSYIKKRIQAGNWSIRFDRIPVEHGMIMVIVGKHVS